MTRPTVATPELGAPGAGAAQARGPEPERMGTFYAFRYRAFWLLWVSNMGTALAQWIQFTSLSWLAYALSGSGALLGAVNGMRTIPSLLVSPLAGVATDRYSRSTVVNVSQVALFVCTFALGLDLLFGTIEIWHLFPFMLLVSVVQSFNMPARQTMVFDVVPRHVVPNAIALNNLGNSVSRTLGSLLGGALITFFGPAQNFFAQGVIYLGVMAAVLFMRLPRRAAGTSPAARRPNVFREMAEGYRYAARDPQLRLTLAIMLINPLFLIPLHLALLPIFSTKVFTGDAADLGLMLGSIGAGGFVGGLLNASLNHVDRRGLLQLAGLFTHSLAHLLFCVVAVLTGQVWLAIPFLALAGAAESIHMTTNMTVLQMLAPEHLRGRVTSLMQLIAVAMPLGILVGGLLADVFPAAVVGSGLSLIGLGMTVAIGLFSPRIRALRLSQLNPGQPAGRVV